MTRIILSAALALSLSGCGVGTAVGIATEVAGGAAGLAVDAVVGTVDITTDVVGTAADVYAVDMMVTQIEDAKGYKKRIGFEHIIETALGMQNVHEIAGASKRNESLHFGVADYAASTRARISMPTRPSKASAGSRRAASRAASTSRRNS